MRQNQRSIRIFGALLVDALLPIAGPSEMRAQTGIVAGDDVDGETGDPLVGAYVFLKETGFGR